MKKIRSLWVVYSHLNIITSFKASLSSYKVLFTREFFYFNGRCAVRSVFPFSFSNQILFLISEIPNKKQDVEI